jgi:hypothetical protein
MCQGKVRHESKAAASVAWYRHYSRDGVNLDVYQCRECGGFHLGHAAGIGRANLKAERQGGTSGVVALRQPDR